MTPEEYQAIRNEIFKLKTKQNNQLNVINKEHNDKKNEAVSWNIIENEMMKLKKEYEQN